MPVFGPYRFARINRWIHTPDWGPLATQDVPFAGALDGEFELTIKTRTPTCVGGPRMEKQGNQNAQVFPFRLPDGRYAIPKSSLEGMIRSILEIATFARLGERIDERWPGLRDISGRPAATVARHRERLVKRTNGVIRFNVKSAWLRKTQDGRSVELVKCKLGRIEIEDVSRKLGLEGAPADALADGGNDAAERYAAVGITLATLGRLEEQVDNAAPRNHWHQSINSNIFESRHTFVATGGRAGTIVLTGKPAGRRGESPYATGRKKREFIFSSPSRQQVIEQAISYVPSPVPDSAWSSFLEDNTTTRGDASTPAWKFWKPAFDRGEPVPVFYLGDGAGIVGIGLAMMFKAPFGGSSHDLLRNSNSEHLDPPSAARAPDFPSTLLGAAAFMDAEGMTSGGRGRVSFPTASCVDRQVRPQPKTRTLLAPRPSYYPAYVRQEGNGQISRDDRLAVYANDSKADDAFVKTPELAGVKLWPASQNGSLRADPPAPRDQRDDGAAVKTMVHLLPKGTVFKGRVRFHNLLPCELGALLWALRGGLGPGKAVHRLGMGKPYGFGEVQLSFRKIEIVGAGEISGEDAVQAFEKHMIDIVCKVHGDEKDWRQTPQVLALRAAMTRGYVADGDLEPMTMEDQQTARRQQDFMAAFVDEARELGTPADHGASISEAGAAQYRPPPANFDGFEVGDIVKAIEAYANDMPTNDEPWTVLEVRKRTVKARSRSGREIDIKKRGVVVVERPSGGEPEP